jgi:hypothetical protein
VEGIAAPFFIASALLALAGAAKLTRPEPTAGAMKSVGLPGSRLAAQSLGLAEVVIGAVAIVFGGAIAAGAVAVSYLGFAGFVVVALRMGGALASCGCFGTDDTPPTLVHLILNLAAAGAAAAAAVAGVGGIPDVLGDQPAFGLPFLGFVLMGTWFAYLALSVLPTLAPRTATR